jgi:hypothetical protein
VGVESGDWIGWFAAHSAGGEIYLLIGSLATPA